MTASESFRVEGLAGERMLSGEIPVMGAKNEALKVFAAALLFSDPVRIERVPDIEDIRRMVELVQALGAGVERESHDTYVITPNADMSTTLPRALSQRFRSSMIAAGPILARFGEVTFYSPGGCHLGTRPINFSIEGFGQFGASVNYEIDDERTRYDVKAPEGGLKGSDIVLRTPAVSATELLIMTAVLTKGTTRIYNAAMEPEITAWTDFLNECGARITGAGTPTIVVEGVEELHAKGKTCTIIPDRIETGTFAILGALSAKELSITNCNPEHLRVPLETLRRTGVPIEIHDDRIIVREPGRQMKSTMQIKTHEYPGFPTDLQPQMVLFLTQVRGVNSVFETIYESRFEYLDDLRSMGANIELSATHAIIKGPTALSAKEMPAIDLRAGMAFVLAALVAEGTSVVHNVYNISRGYEAIDERLRAVGVSIERV